MASHTQWGISLVEVLVSVVVLAVGLLGTLQLHIVAKRSSFQSFQHARAMNMAADALERMRLNPTQLAGYQGHYGVSLIPQPEVSCHSDTSVIVPCSAEQLRLWDRFQWQQRLLSVAEVSGQGNRKMTQVVGCIHVDGSRVGVVVSWQGLQQGVDSVTEADGWRFDCGTATERRRQVYLDSMVVP
ncbi:type IV pilus assembly protein PilV [Ferrimonas sediminum]|uniref:Type IV pilus assembly protein PilV n=1 Tax=Ferrimonas sediminum TaxID=718193 RepID=A0A1G8ZBW6_9GAMM|nr:type IV pilus modification protein PilV [Ferrimonas sediminum]SDK12517.1 type IV pilus assembly protein PilV [Ferrimonas sediminum]